MKTLKFLSVISLVVLASGCAQYGGYRPVVDPYNDPRAGYIGQDGQECQAIASQNSSMGSGIVANGAVGALIGGAGGAAIGALMGNPATGAALGGTIGGLGGAAKGGFEADSGYQRIFRNCMRNRGHHVLD